MRWEEKPLGDVCEIIGGGTPSKKVEAYYGGEIPWATVGDMNVEQLIATDLRITPAGLENSSARVIPSGNVIIATRVGLGKSCILNEDTAINQDLKGLVPKGSIGLLPRFLFRWTQSIAPRIIAAGTGATVQGVKIKFVSQLPIPIPPLYEQGRIVEVLDEAFAAIDKAKANIERNLTNARELFQSRLNDIFSNPSEDWEVKPLGEVCKQFQYGTSSKAHREGDVPVLRMGNIQDGCIDWADLKFSSEVDEVGKYELRKGDVLFNRTNSPEWVGKTALFDGSRRAIHAGYLIRVTPEMAVLDPQFLVYFLNLDTTMDYGRSVMSSSVNQANINATKLKAYRIPLPPISIQNEIVQTIGLLRNAVHAIESKYESELDNLEELRQSILEQAFEGKLTEPVAA